MTRNANRAPRSRVFATYACLAVALIAAGACRDDSKTRPAPANPNRPAKPQPRKLVGKPAGRFLFQPYFHYQDREPSANGTGFLIRCPGGRIAAVASAHFVDFDGPPLQKAEWLSIGDWEPLISFDKSWGMPGRAASKDGDIDLRPDYLILPVEKPVPDEWVLKIDKRPLPRKGEIVWFPNKTSEAVNGYLWIHGVVLEAKPGYIMVQLDQRVEMQSQSGSPIISSQTGRVIGTLSSAGELRERTFLLLCPASSIRDVIKRATTFPALKDVVGRS